MARGDRLETSRHQVTLPAQILWRLARCPRTGPTQDVIDSIDLEGWLPKHPAELVLIGGMQPAIRDGNHRLAHLAKVDRLDTLVPVVIVTEWVERSPLS